MRVLSSFVGVGFAIVTFLVVAFSIDVSLGVFVSVPGLAIVLLGTISAVLLSFSLRDLKKFVYIVQHVFLREEVSPRKVAFLLLQYCQASNVKSLNTDEAKKIHPLVKDCVVLLNDGYDEVKIRNIITQRIYSLLEQETMNNNLIRSMAKYPPAFGMVGTVIGLIALMATVGSEGIENVGHNMAVALTTTLYGLIIANFIFKPLADNFDMRSTRNLSVREMILETMILYSQNASMLALQDVVNSFLEPSQAVDVIGGLSDAA